MSVCFLLSKEEVEGLLNSLSENDLEKYFKAKTFAKFVSYAKEKLKSTNEILSTLENAGEDLRTLANKIEKGKIGSAYDNELCKEIAEELEVEAFNEDFMRSKSISEISRTDYLISLCVKEKIVFLFTLEILFENDKNARTSAERSKRPLE